MQELKEAQIKLQSMVALTGSDPGLREALDERREELQHEMDALRVEGDELKQCLAEGALSEDREESEK